MEKRIAHITLLNNIPPHRDGSFNHLIMDLLELRNGDISISVYSEDAARLAASKESRIYLIRPLAINFFVDFKKMFLKRLLKPWRKNHNLFHLKFVAEASEILLRNEIRHVVVWGFPELVSLLRTRLPNIHITFAQRHFEYSRETDVYEEANAIVMQNYGQYRRALDLHLQIPLPVYIIPNGVEIDIFKPIDTSEILPFREKLGLSTRELVLIFPSKLAPHKGAFLLEPLMRQLNSTGKKFKLLVVGDNHPKYNRGKYALDFKEVRDAIDSNEDILWIKGGVNRMEMVNYYNLADLAIFPSLWKEGFSMSAIESLSCGLPILAPNCGCYLELVKDGRNGYLLMQDALLEAMVEKIKFLDENRNVLEEMKRSSRVYVTDFLTRAKVLRNFNYYFEDRFDRIDSRI